MGIWLRIHPDRFCLPANRAGTGPRRTLVPYPKDDEWDGGTKTPSLAVLDHSTGINAGQRGPGGRVRPIVGGGSVRPRALSAPYTADFDAFPCMSCFRFASYNAVTSGNAFVEVGGVEPAGGYLCHPQVRGHITWSGHFSRRSRRCPSCPVEAGKVRQTRVTVSRMCQ